MHYFFGFSHWKHEFVRKFFSDLKAEEIVFINPFFRRNYFKLALKKGLGNKSVIYIWGRKNFPEVEAYVQEHNLRLYRIEDGFIRSVGLGSDLTQPYSLVVDSRGIYFDPTQPSDLEYILQNHDFEATTLNRAKELRKYLIEKKLSKYNLYENIKLDIPQDRKIVLVPGQVEDDASIKFGAPGMSNLKLLMQARENTPDGYIIYKPHPDVLVGNRVGNMSEERALKYADKVVTEVGIDSVLGVCDEVHTMTSLVGFEALMREKQVYTYGLPFYAGWGLTHDTQTLPRRTKKLDLDTLVSATLIKYPKYINPFSYKPCEVEELLEILDNEKKIYDGSFIYRIKLKVRNFISRKSQLLLRIITLKK